MNILESSREECEVKAAEIITSKLNETVKEKGKAIFGICGGTSVEGIFRKLLRFEVDWQKVHIFMVDERCVSLHSTDSNYWLAYNAFIKELMESHKISEENVHPFVYDAAQAVGSLRRYNSAFQNRGGKFDIILLSSGEDCHIAALYPKHRSITNETKEFFVMKDSPKPPKERMTSPRKMIQESKSAVLLFFGKQKRQAFENFKSDVKIEECPAKLASLIPDSYVFKSD